MARSVFDFESEDRVESPERLNEYIRVATPGTWIAVLALVLVLASVILWGFKGRIPQKANFKGVVDPSNNYTIDLIVDATQFMGTALEGKEVQYQLLADGTSGTGKVIKASKAPFSREELSDMLQSDFLAYTLISSDYSYIVEVEPDQDLSDYALGIADAVVITSEVKPIYYLTH